MTLVLLLELLGDRVRARLLKPMFAHSYALAATLMYWVTVPIVGIVEHDACILTFLQTIKELEADGVAPWPACCWAARPRTC